MSWYVRELIKDSYKIKRKVGSVNYNPMYGSTKASFFFSDSDIPVGYDRHLINDDNSFDDDNYNDLLSVEMAIERLKELGLISDFELDVLSLVSSGATFNYITKTLSITNPTLRKIFKKLCDKIAFYLGDYFTDDGYIDYMQKKYNLNDDEVEKITKIIKRIK